MTTPLNPRIAAYLGSFDPLTLGHTDLIHRGADIFDKLIVGIGINPDKEPLFTPQARLEMTTQVVGHLPNVEVRCFHGLAVNFIRECGAAVMLRGIRTLTDMEAEFRMTLANHTLDPDIETVFLMSREKFTHISSTLIKQVAQMGGTESARYLKEFVPPEIIPPLIARYQSRK